MAPIIAALKKQQIPEMAKHFAGQTPSRAAGRTGASPAGTGYNGADNPFNAAGAPAGSCTIVDNNYRCTVPRGGGSDLYVGIPGGFTLSWSGCSPSSTTCERLPPGLPNSKASSRRAARN